MSSFSYEPLKVRVSNENYSNNDYDFDPDKKLSEIEQKMLENERRLAEIQKREEELNLAVMGSLNFIFLKLSYDFQTRKQGRISASTIIERLLSLPRTSTIQLNQLATTETLMVDGSRLQEALTSPETRTRAAAGEALHAIVIHVDLRDRQIVRDLREIRERIHRARAVRGRRPTMMIF